LGSALGKSEIEQSVLSATSFFLSFRHHLHGNRTVGQNCTWFLFRFR